MSSNKITIPSLYVYGLVLGAGFTTIPAAGNFLTSPHGFGLSPSEYGFIFIPMIVGSILASFFGGFIAKKTSVKHLFILSSILNVLSMMIFSACNLVIHEAHFAFFTLLVGMLCLGLGFGGSLTAINAYVIQLFPNKTSTAVTGLHSCLGLGTALGPLLFNHFLSHHIWWFDGLIIASAYTLLLCIGAIFFPLHVVSVKHSQQSDSTAAQSPKHLLLLLIFIALIYGICETTFGNWGTIFLHDDKGLSQVQSNYALSIFWGAITAGRILVFILSFSIKPERIYRVLAPLILLSLIAMHLFGHNAYSTIYYGIFALAGIGCSAFLPLTVSFAGRLFFSNAEEVSGEVLSSYLLGYGIASIGVGLLNKIEHLSFQMVFMWLMVPVLTLAILCFYVTRKTHVPPHAHEE